MSLYRIYITEERARRSPLLPPRAFTRTFRRHCSDAKTAEEFAVQRCAQLRQAGAKVTDWRVVRAGGG